MGIIPKSLNSIVALPVFIDSRNTGLEAIEKSRFDFKLMLFSSLWLTVTVKGKLTVNKAVSPATILI
jgi:hypothetical protein